MLIAGGTKVAIGKQQVSEALFAQRNGHQLGLLLVAVSAVAWSTAGLFTRLIPLDTGTILVWRGVFGTIGILALAFAMQGRTAIREFRKMGWPGWSFAMISAVGMLCFITSLRMTTVAHVSIIYATVPLVAAALAWLLIGEKPARSAVVASVFSLFGVSIIVGLGAEGNLAGNVLAFGMTFSLAVMMVISRRYQDIPILPAACVSALLSSVAAFPFSNGLFVSGYEMSLLALFGLVNSAIGLALFTVGSRMIPAIETALIGALDAPLAPIWVWLCFAEIPSAETLTGGAIVFIAVVLHIVQQSRQSTKTH
ncbi:DMT family transporter [Parasedimentitalea maritima]|uniref:DMT family transporter n=1 Tax=Parasedimentitalea maritima TaxID=2578117 RepID=A0ABY2UWZ6_9RHOB|nr:DMT family transporter [Zongyanglinia marina]